MAAENELPGKNSRAMLPLLEELAERDTKIERLRTAIGTVCEGWTLPEGARKVLEAALWAEAAPNVDAEISRLREALEWISDNGPDDAWELREKARKALAPTGGLKGA